MRSISVIAFGLLQLTSATIVPKLDDDTRPRAISEGVFTSENPPKLFRFAQGGPVNASVPFTFQDLGLSSQSGVQTVDVPGLSYELVNGTTKLEVKLLRPFRIWGDEGYFLDPKYVYADEPGMVHDPVGMIDQSMVITSGLLTKLPVKRLQGGQEIEDGDYYLMVQVALPEGVYQYSYERERWISSPFRIQKQMTTKPGEIPQPSSSAASSAATAKTVFVDGEERSAASN